MRTIDYDKKKAEIENEYRSKLGILSLEYDFGKIIPNIKLFISSNTVFIDAKNKEEVVLVLNNISPTNKTIERDYKDGKTLNYPYEVYLSGSNNGPDKCIINYHYNDYHIRLSFNDKIINDFTKVDYRGVNDTELHYYGGVSKNVISRMKIPFHTFKEGEILKWYGSHIACWNVEVATKIINYLKQ